MLHEMIRAKIDEHGYTFLGVFDPEGVKPTFAYSLGFTERGWPELLMIGNMPPPLLEGMLESIAKRWTDAGAPFTGDIPDWAKFADGTDCPVRLIEVEPDYAVNQYAFQLGQLYEGHPVRVVQVVWPDDKGLFPDNAKWNPAMHQPLLPPLVRH